MQNFHSGARGPRDRICINSSFHSRLLVLTPNVVFSIALHGKVDDCELGPFEYSSPLTTTEDRTRTWRQINAARSDSV